MNVKRLIAALLALAVVFSLVACGGKKNEEVKDNNVIEEQISETVENAEEKVEIETEKEDVVEKEPVSKPQEKPEATDKKPQDTKIEAKPEAKPEVKPEEKPEVKPEEKPQEQATTVGQKLLADFKAKAGSESSALSLAEKIVSNPIVVFSAASMPVEPGFLAGFGNTEIKGFKDGAMFGPVIGSVPFVGYVFVLEDGVNVSDFISTLKSSADLRWNICVEAEEMVAGSSGNKVFFVMCPKSLEA